MEKNIEIAYSIGMATDTIARMLGTTEALVLDEIELFWNATEAIQKEYYEQVLPLVLSDIQAMIAEIPDEEKREIRRRYLFEAIHDKKALYLATGEERLGRELQNLLREAQIYMGVTEEITSAMIEQARNYPLTELIPHKNNTALCPFHNDKRPSLNIKNNFYYCHSCGAHGDSIDLIKHIKNISFKEAVNYLLKI